MWSFPNNTNRKIWLPTKELKGENGNQGGHSPVLPLSHQKRPAFNRFRDHPRCLEAALRVVLPVSPCCAVRRCHRSNSSATTATEQPTTTTIAVFYDCWKQNVHDSIITATIDLVNSAICFTTAVAADCCSATTTTTSRSQRKQQL